MKLREVIFTDNLPSIDLHGLDRDTARVKVLEFINDNLIMKNSIVVIIFGNGLGILKQEVNRVLSKHKKVIDYKNHYNNSGMIIVELNIDK